VLRGDHGLAPVEKSGRLDRKPATPSGGVGLGRCDVDGLAMRLTDPAGISWRLDVHLLRKQNEAENMLKTKDRARGFFENEAENILKEKALTKTHRTLNKCDTLSALMGARST
jgi:hypothetical protein